MYYAKHLYDGHHHVFYTGVHIEFEKGTFGMLVPRSSLGVNYGLRLANTTGIIDEDYRGEIIIKADMDVPVVPEQDKPIAQLVIMPYLRYSLKPVNEINETERGEGGFGSTD